ncbi:MAG TPA: hypothetical protein VFM68_04090 [Candidatus Saccharimonadales bacterium]|nr:hypothetical protein [Candidatus Saccharimonadales bacterium]
MDSFERKQQLIKKQQQQVRKEKKRKLRQQRASDAPHDILRIEQAAQRIYVRFPDEHWSSKGEWMRIRWTGQKRLMISLGEVSSKSMFSPPDKEWQGGEVYIGRDSKIYFAWDSLFAFGIVARIDSSKAKFALSDIACHLERFEGSRR